MLASLVGAMFAVCRCECLDTLSVRAYLRGSVRTCRASVRSLTRLSVRRHPSVRACLRSVGASLRASVRIAHVVGDDSMTRRCEPASAGRCEPASQPVRTRSRCSADSEIVGASLPSLVGATARCSSSRVGVERSTASVRVAPPRCELAPSRCDCQRSHRRRRGSHRRVSDSHQRVSGCGADQRQQIAPTSSQIAPTSVREIAPTKRQRARTDKRQQIALAPTKRQPACTDKRSERSHRRAPAGSHRPASLHSSRSRRGGDAVLLSGSAGGADGADDLSTDNERHPAFNGDRALERQDPPALRRPRQGRPETLWSAA